MNLKKIGVFAGLVALLYFVWQYMQKGKVQKSGYSLSTPIGGASVTEDPLAGTVNVQATIVKKKSKKGLFKGKLKGALKKVLPGAASIAANLIPGVGPAISKAIDKATTKSPIT